MLDAPLPSAQAAGFWRSLDVKRSGTPGALLPTPALLEMLSVAREVDWREAGTGHQPLLHDLLTQAGAEIERLLALLSEVEACPEAQPMTEAARWRFVLLTRFTLALSRQRDLRDQAERHGNAAAAHAYDHAFQVVLHEAESARAVGQQVAP